METLWPGCGPGTAGGPAVRPRGARGRHGRGRWPAEGGPAARPRIVRSVSEPFSTVDVAGVPQVAAPDGSAVRPLCVLPGAASFAQFSLAPGQVSRAVCHATVEEIWFVTRGGGEMWRGQDGREELTVLGPGVCLTIPLGTAFQFRAGEEGLTVVAATVPEWPRDGADEARFVPGRW